MDLKNIQLKTLLVFPPLLGEKKDGDPLGGSRNTPQLGIATLVGYLNEKGYTKIKSINLRDSDSLIRGTTKIATSILKKLLINERPDIVGISAVFDSQLFWAIKIARILKKLDRKIFLVLGGQTMSRSQNYLISNPNNIRNPFDAIIIGDGEEPLEKLIYNLSAQKGLKNIPNLFLKDKSSGKFLKNESIFIASKKNLKTKPCFDGFTTSVFVPIRASINCYWGKCAFCPNSKSTNKKYKLLEIKDLIYLIKKLKKELNQDFFYFYDDSLPPAYLKKLARQLIKQKLNIRWILRGLCFDKNLIDLNLLKLLKESGCSLVALGLESFSDRILKLMKKMHTTKLSLRILRLLKEAKIEVSLHMMFGFPTETENDIKKTLTFLKEYPSLYKKAYINYFTLLKDTYVYCHPQNFNLMVEEINNQKKFITKDKKTSPKKIQKMIKRFGLKNKIHLFFKV